MIQILVFLSPYLNSNILMSIMFCLLNFELGFIILSALDTLKS